ncbi:hypothetical protein DESUT3_37840 [Desulfuromonas versatilis]|uniref:GxxExxY protein n=1 Tax=Desulfuromonas versatilis TaxID=2802975 RepID=A0ABN6E2Z9_9BACT|nr:GxxExxY protein [Desulfuromonas versatilis]BCR06715.1 hypothetical protein DESUT3_37840 [Desulfuromonas versatilis]
MVRDEAYINSITELIIGCAYQVGRTLGQGFLEKVYENALCHELSKSELSVAQQYPLNVIYDGIVVGEFFADLVVQNEVIVELKAVKGLDASHFSQCMNYLKATGKRVGLLINFGTSKVEIRRVVNSF